MPIAQRTVNPLHFEDLEPHRFEDLIRQLAYNWRSWRYLDATGNAGNDDGVDVRGIEYYRTGRVPVSSDDESGPDPNDSGNDVDPNDDAREWLISCKRYQRLGPTEARAVVRETLTEPEHAPYGYVLAVACDLSADAMAAVREEAISLGVEEAHIWSRPHLEDLLFRPDYEDLLFVYFGLSIRTRRNSRLAQIRAESSIRRALKSSLNLSQLSGAINQAVITVRDIEDQSYPYVDEVQGFIEMDCPPWHLAQIAEFSPIGITLKRFSYNGLIAPDGTWDYDEKTGRNPAHSFDYAEQLYWNELEQSADTPEARPTTTQGAQEITVHEYWGLRYADIVFVDAVEDGYRSSPTVYCRFRGNQGPYRGPLAYSGEKFGPHGYIPVDVEREKRSQLYIREEV